MNETIKFDPQLDLVFERTTGLSPEKIWKAWTDPETLMKWFCPLPWKVTECKIELYPGGEFYTLMSSPEGQTFPNHGTYLEVVKNKKIVWTNALVAGFRPAPVKQEGFVFTATILLTTIDKSTHYKAILSHSDAKNLKTHEQMGFQEGWGKAFEQMSQLQF